MPPANHCVYQVQMNSSSLKQRQFGAPMSVDTFFLHWKALPPEEMPPPGASLETKGAPVFMTPFAQVQLCSDRPGISLSAVENTAVSQCSGPKTQKRKSCFSSSLKVSFPDGHWQLSSWSGPSCEWSRNSFPFPNSFVHLYRTWLLLFLLGMLNLLVLF